MKCNSEFQTYTNPLGVYIECNLEENHQGHHISSDKSITWTKTNPITPRGKQPKPSCQCGPFEFNNKKEYKEHIDNGIHELEMNSKIAYQWVEERDYCP